MVSQNPSSFAVFNKLLFSLFCLFSTPVSSCAVSQAATREVRYTLNKWLVHHRTNNQSHSHPLEQMRGTLIGLWKQPALVTDYTSTLKMAFFRSSLQKVLRHLLCFSVYLYESQVSPSIWVSLLVSQKYYTVLHFDTLEQKTLKRKCSCLKVIMMLHNNCINTGLHLLIFISKVTKELYLKTWQLHKNLVFPIICHYFHKLATQNVTTLLAGYKH